MKTSWVSCLSVFWSYMLRVESVFSHLLESVAFCFGKVLWWRVNGIAKLLRETRRINQWQKTASKIGNCTGRLHNVKTPSPGTESLMYWPLKATPVASRDYFCFNLQFLPDSRLELCVPELLSQSFCSGTNREVSHSAVWDCLLIRPRWDEVTFCKRDGVVSWWSGVRVLYFPMEPGGRLAARLRFLFFFLPGHKGMTPALSKDGQRKRKRKRICARTLLSWGTTEWHWLLFCRAERPVFRWPPWMKHPCRAVPLNCVNVCMGLDNPKQSQPSHLMTRVIGAVQLWCYRLNGTGFSVFSKWGASHTEVAWGSPFSVITQCQPCCVIRGGTEALIRGKWTQCNGRIMSTLRTLVRQVIYHCTASELFIANCKFGWVRMGTGQTIQNLLAWFLPLLTCIASCRVLFSLWFLSKSAF